MRLWIDTEFNEYRGELISVGIVDEDGREFYEVLPPPLAGYGPWVAQHVVPILNKPAITLAELQAKLHVFLAHYTAVHLIADWPEDIEFFLHLLVVGPGQRIGPDRWTMEVRRDLPSTAETSSIPHHALEDAKALRAGQLLESAQSLRDLRTAALLALGLLWMTERQSDKVYLAYTTLRDALGGKEALRAGIQAAMGAGYEADHPHDVDWWAGKK
jgi:hypothetical protein